MSKPQSIIPLISAWEAFVLEHPEGSLPEFSKWLVRQTHPEIPTDQHAQDVKAYMDEHGKNHPPLAPMAGFMIGRLYKFIRVYAKPVLAELPIHSLDDFAFLAGLDVKKQCTKKELIIENVMEITTGMDILKRLIGMAFIEEQTNPNDKREKLISLTPKGREVLFACYQKLSGIQDVLGQLNLTERQQLIHSLQQLNHFHTQQYHQILGIKTDDGERTGDGISAN